MAEKQFFKSKYLSQDYDLPGFVKQSPNYSLLFVREYEIVRNDGKWGFIAEGDDSPVRYDYDNFFDAFDVVERVKNSCVHFNAEIAKEVFCDQVEEALHNDSNENIKVYWKKDDKWYRMIYCRCGDSSVKALVESYQQWKGLNALLDEDYFCMDNFMNIYDWLNSHPSFWLEKRNGSFVDWDTESGISSLGSGPVEVCAITGKDIKMGTGQQRDAPVKIKWWIEGGEHVINPEDPEEYCAFFYYDERLDASGDTYDEALINFAKNVWLNQNDKYPIETHSHSAIIQI